MPAFVTGGFRWIAIQQTSPSRRFEWSSQYHARFRLTSYSRLPRRCLFLDELDPSSADSHAVQRVETEKSLLGQAAAEAANRAMKASARPPEFTLDERWRSTPSPTTSEPRLSQPGRASMLGCSSITRTMYLQSLRLLLCWLARPTIPHDWTAPTWDQTLTVYFVWSYDHRTWPARRLQQCGGRFQTSHDLCHEAPPRQPLASRAGGAWSRDYLVLQRQGHWCCWWLVGLRNTTRISRVSTFACSSKRTCGRRKDWRCDASSSFRRSREFLELRESHPRERAGSSLAKLGSTTPGCHRTWHAISICLPYCKCSKQLEANDSSSPSSYTHAAPQMEDAVKQLRCHRLHSRCPPSR